MLISNTHFNIVSIFVVNIEMNECKELSLDRNKMIISIYMFGFFMIGEVRRRC